MEKQPWSRLSDRSSQGQQYKAAGFSMASLHCAKMHTNAQITGKQIWANGKAIDRDLKIWYVYWQELLDKITKKPPSGEITMTMFV
jgi:hypothetical protein